MLNIWSLQDANFYVKYEQCRVEAITTDYLIRLYSQATGYPGQQNNFKIVAFTRKSDLLTLESLSINRFKN